MRGWPLGWGDHGNQPQRQLSSRRDKSSQPEWGWGATVEMAKKAPNKAGGPDLYEVTLLVMCKPQDSANGERRQDSVPTPMVRGIRLVAALTCVLSFEDGRTRARMVCKGHFGVAQPKLESNHTQGRVGPRT